MGRWRVVGVVLVLFAGLAAPAAAAPGHGVFPDARSPVQEELWDLFTLVGWMSIIISAVVIAALVYVVVKFRGDPLIKKKGDWFTHDARLEVTWTIATALVLVFLGVVTAQTMSRIEPGAQDRIDGEAIDVVALGRMWQWEFVYPDGNATTDELHVEAGRSVDLQVLSCDVIHSLYIPELGVKIDTSVARPDVCEAVKRTGEMPEGVDAARFWFRADDPGRYDVKCAEYCGAGHAYMAGEVVAFEPGSRRKPYGPPLDLGRVVHVEYTGSGDALQVAPASIRATAGDLVTFVVHNNGTANHGFTLGAPYNRSTGVIPPGETARIQRVTLDRAGSFAYYSDVGADRRQGLNGTIDVAAGQVVPVELTEWTIQDGTEFEPGTTYAFKVYNNGTTDHNLFIGIYAESRDARDPVVGESESFSPAEGPVWLNVTMPDRDVTFQWWCNVPGHAGLGMLDDITVGEGGGGGQGGSGGGASTQGADVLLPGWEVAGAVAGMAVAAVVVRIRD